MGRKAIGPMCCLTHVFIIMGCLLPPYIQESKFFNLLQRLYLFYDLIQVQKLTEEWATKWKETQKIMKVGEELILFLSLY